MKQYRITSDDLNQDSDNDAYLAPDDPVNELKIASYLAGLGSEARLQEYRSQQIKINNTENSMTGSEKRQFERDNNIRPGDPEWFELWFGKNK
jgi:hypothetical protein